jgi:hypothetical protein
MTPTISNAGFEKLVSAKDAIEISEPTFRDLGGGKVANLSPTLNCTHLGGNKLYFYSCMDSSVPRLELNLIRLTSDQVEERMDNGSP